MSIRSASLVVALLATIAANAIAEDVRSDEHERFAAELWTYLSSDAGYKQWNPSQDLLVLPTGPLTQETDKFYLNPQAVSATGAHAHGSVIVAEHFEGDEPTGVSVWYKMNDGYDARYHDWYFAYYSPSGEVLKTSADDMPHVKRGFVTIEEDDRLWVFATASKPLVEFHSKGELAKHVIRPGVGPDGTTLKAPDAETIDAYLAAKPGFFAIVSDGGIWIFRDDAEELAEFLEKGELAKHVIRPDVGPGGITLKAPDAETIDSYLGQ